MTRTRLGVLTALFVAPASALEGQTPSVRDSGGVQIVINPVARDSAYVASVPEIRIGVETGAEAYQLHRVGPIAIDQAGTLFVANMGDTSIRVFGPDGTFLRQFGRGGRGPGEFVGLSRLWFEGDTLVVMDVRVSRATLLTKSGEVLTTWDLRVPDGPRAELVGKTAGGWIAWVRPPSAHFTGELFTIIRDTAELRVWNASTRQPGPVLRRQAGQRRIARTEVYPVTPLFEPTSVTAVGAGGVQYQATDGQYPIDVYDARGRHIRRIVRPLTPRPIPANAFDLLRGDRRPGSEMVIAMERSSRHPVAPAHQMIGAILVAPDGSILVQRIDDIDPVRLEHQSGLGSRDRGVAATALGSNRWERFDSAGRYVGAVRFPVRFQPRHFDGRRATGVLQDANDVEYVVAYRLSAR